MNKISSSDLISLKILESIEKEPVITQRDLSYKLDIALGLTNAYIKRLCKKGYIKVKNLSGKKIKYILTVKGFTEKAKLTYRYMHHSFEQIKEIKSAIEKNYQKMLQDNVRKILIWGDGELAELCFITLSRLPVEITGFVGFNEDIKQLNQIKLYRKDEIDNLDFDAVLAATFDEGELAQLQSMANIKKKKTYYIWQS